MNGRNTAIWQAVRNSRNINTLSVRQVWKTYTQITNVSKPETLLFTLLSTHPSFNAWHLHFFLLFALQPSNTHDFPFSLFFTSPTHLKINLTVHVYFFFSVQMYQVINPLQSHTNNTQAKKWQQNPKTELEKKSGANKIYKPFLYADEK